MPPTLDAATLDPLMVTHVGPMLTQVLVALIAACAAILAAGLAFRSSRQARKASRQEQLELQLERAGERLLRSDRQQQLMWLYCRQLIDHIYKGCPPPPPAPPAGLLND